MILCWIRSELCDQEACLYHLIAFRAGHSTCPVLLWSVSNRVFAGNSVDGTCVTIYENCNCVNPSHRGNISLTIGGTRAVLHSRLAKFRLPLLYLSPVV